MNLLYLIPGWESDGAAAQIAVYARGLARQGRTVHVCSLSPPPASIKILQSDGVSITDLGWTRRLDPRPLLRLRRLVRTLRPDVIHACRPVCLRALALAVGRVPGRLVVSRPLPPRRRDGVSRLDRWLLGRADAVIAGSSAEASRCTQAGVSIGRVAVVPPGIEIQSDHNTTQRAKLPGEPSARRILCAGRLEDYKGYREAVWSLDVLRYVAGGLRLVVVGDGPDRARLSRFIGLVGAGGHTDLLGTRNDLPVLLRSAEVVWVPSLADGGARVALEAMAAERAVVASRLPSLAEAVRDGETGLLVPPGDKIALASATLRLLEDDGLRHGLGEAGRRRVAEHFSAARAVRGAAEVYDRLAA